MASDKVLTFPNGRRMPVIGLGLWKGGDEGDLENAIDKALDAGYRHFDTAFFYETEDVLGKSIKKWIQAGKGKREDLFIVTKLPWNGNLANKVEHFLRQSLKDLDLQYVDLYLMHWPIGLQYVSDRDFVPKAPDGSILIDTSTDLEAVWGAMEKLVDSNLTKSIGISNFKASQVERIVKVARIQPANHQVEMHAYFQQNSLRDLCRKHNITVCAYSPLGGPWRKTYPGLQDNLPAAVNLLDDPVVKEIGNKHQKSASQILLRHLIQLGVAAVPKSSNEVRLRQNLDIFNFQLDAFDMKRLQALDQGEAGRTNFAWAGLKEHPEIPF